MPTEPNPSSFTVIEESSLYFLSQDADGFALWSVKTNEESPILTFPPDDEGEASARAAFTRETRFGRWAGVLVVAAFVSAFIWILAAISERAIAIFADARALSEVRTDVPESWVVRAWLLSISSVANAGFTIAVGLSLVIWLHRRYRREG